LAVNLPLDSYERDFVKSVRLICGVIAGVNIEKQTDWGGKDNRPDGGHKHVFSKKLNTAGNDDKGTN